MTCIMTIAAGVALGYFLVQFLTKNARTVQEGDATITDENSRQTAKARLHKSLRDRQVAGVCGGIAEYLNVDPSIVRLVTVVLVFGWGSGLLAYIVCALILPAE